jgi:hypothetical protein
MHLTEDIIKEANKNGFKEVELLDKGHNAILTLDKNIECYVTPFTNFKCLFDEIKKELNGK